MNVVAIPITESNTELQGMRHSSMTALGVGGTTDRNSLRARQANGAAMLVEVDAEAVAVLQLVFYTWVARSRSGSSLFAASALNKPEDCS